jgi:hypothetical protein
VGIKRCEQSKRREASTENSKETTDQGGVSTSSKDFEAGMQPCSGELGSATVECVECMARGSTFSNFSESCFGTFFEI